MTRIEQIEPEVLEQPSHTPHAVTPVAYLSEWEEQRLVALRRGLPRRQH